MGRPVLYGDDPDSRMNWLLLDCLAAKSGWPNDLPGAIKATAERVGPVGDLNSTAQLFLDGEIDEAALGDALVDCCRALTGRAKLSDLHDVDLFADGAT